MEYSVQRLNEIYGQEAEIDTNVRLDLGDKERKKKLEELTAESDPFTRLMKEVLGDQV